MTMPVTMNSIETSGSLTGHILAQGWDRGVDTPRRSNLKVGIAMLVVLLVLTGVSLLFLFTAGFLIQRAFVFARAKPSTVQAPEPRPWIPAVKRP